MPAAGARPARLVVSLPYGDRRFFGFFFRQVVAEERPVPLTFLADVQVEGDEFLCRSCADFLTHL